MMCWLPGWVAAGSGQMLSLNVWMDRTKVLQMLCKIIKDKSPLNVKFLDLWNSFKQPLLALLLPQHYTTDWQPLLYHIFQLYSQALYIFSKKGTWHLTQGYLLIVGISFITQGDLKIEANIPKSGFTLTLLFHSK